MTERKPYLQTHPDGLQYNFGQFCLQVDGTLLRDSAVLSLPPKETEILRLLVSKAGEIVSIDQLRKAAWGEVHVSADSLPRCISSLRSRIGQEDCIQTVYKRGYRFTLPVEQVSVETLSTAKSRVGTGRQVARMRSLPRLAILPFKTLPGVPEFFGPGIAEETMLRLSRARHASAEVMARDSVFTLAAQGQTAQDVGKTLHADLALTGAIVALPLHFRVRAEMIRVSDAVQLWVEDFLVPRGLLAYVDARMAKRVAARILDTFAKAITPISVARLGIKALSVPATQTEATRSEAYSTYLRALSQWNTFRLHAMQDAIHLHQKALELDAGLVSARVHLLHSYLAMSSFGYMHAETAADLARRQAETVLSVCSTTQSVYPALGWIHFFHDRDMDAAAAAFARPQSPAHNLWASVYQVRFALGQGRLSEGVQLLRAALETNPYAPALHWRLTWALHLSGDAAGAVEQAKRTIALFPGDPGALFFSSVVFASAGRSKDVADPEGLLLKQAVKLATRLVHIAPALDSGFVTLACAQARLGNLSEARAILDRQNWLGRERFVMRSFQAPLLVELGDYDAALDALSVADEQRCPWLFELLGDPRLQPLHDRPEFQRLSELSGHSLSDDASVA
jgi:DNA-binding winged helix-turn-helix (wHTH) protein/tetratricopeptide (TPR) repeat protein